MSIRKRVKGETPRFFKNIGRIGVALVAIAGVLATPVLAVPVVVVATIGAIGATAKIVSNLVVKNPKDLE